MRVIGGSRLFHPIAGIVAAALACLQPGIDPVFLTLLSTAHGVNPAYHGWIVGATQSGMALGSLVVLQFGARLPKGTFPISALIGLATSLATTQTGHIASLLVLRGGYGFAMGLIYTQAMSSAALWRPNGAYGAVFLIQLLLSTLVALILPMIALAASPALALASHAFVPLAAFAMFALSTGGEPSRAATEARPSAGHERAARPPDAAAWALAGAGLLFSCTTMMVWSFTGALATQAHIGGSVIGMAVATGSVAGAVTALAVMRERPLVPLPVTGMLAGLSLLAPMLAIPTGQHVPFILSIILLNIGSTAIIIRCSGMAAARSRLPRFQRVVAFTHSAGMILGPVSGSLLTSTLGDAGLKGGAAVILLVACGALIFAAVRTARAAGNAEDHAPAIEKAAEEASAAA